MAAITFFLIVANMLCLVTTALQDNAFGSIVFIIALSVVVITAFNTKK